MNLQRFVAGAPEEFYRTIRSLESASAEEVETEKDNRLRPVLDAIVTTAIEAGSHNEELMGIVREALFRIYERARNIRFPRVAGVDLDDIWIWGEVIKRVYILGAVLIERGQFKEARELIDQPITWDDYWDPFLWARHGLTMLARAGRLEKKGLVTVAVQEFDREPWFLQPFADDREQALNRLCQFDFLQCVHVVHRTDRADGPYPSFALYYKSRTEPLVVALVADQRIRRDALPEMDDARLGEIIRALDEVALREAIMVAGWSRGWSDQRIRDYLTTNTPASG